jgi:hypothetical protein
LKERRFDGNPHPQHSFATKTTIDIPEPLYKRAKIHAVDRGMTLKDVVLASLERELAAPGSVEDRPVSYWANRKLRPEFARLQAEGAFKPTPSICFVPPQADIPKSIPTTGISSPPPRGSDSKGLMSSTIERSR